MKVRCLSIGDARAILCPTERARKFQKNEEQEKILLDGIQKYPGGFILKKELLELYMGTSKENDEKIRMDEFRAWYKSMGLDEYKPCPY